MVPRQLLSHGLDRYAARCLIWHAQGRCLGVGLTTREDVSLAEMRLGQPGETATHARLPWWRDYSLWIISSWLGYASVSRYDRQCRVSGWRSVILDTIERRLCGHVEALPTNSG
jgi:hypothetical protein